MRGLCAVAAACSGCTPTVCRGVCRNRRPGWSSTPPGWEKKRAAPPAPRAAAQPDTYVVQEGDSLWTIARDVYGESGRWQDIAKANGLESSRDLTVGQVLSIPRP